MRNFFKVKHLVTNRVSIVSEAQLKGLNLFEYDIVRVMPDTALLFAIFGEEALV